MKTAMQELIEAVNQHYSNPLRTDIFDTNPFLEKEKEQIRTAFESGWNWNFSSEKYYNETYKPETI
jgi:hypothetical protein